MKKKSVDSHELEFQEKIQRLEHAKKELQRKLDDKEKEINDVLKYSDVAIIETTDDLRIINSLGALDYIFGSYADKIERGNNLTKLIYKTTKNTKDKDQSEKPEEEQQDLETQVTNFAEGKKSEIEFKIVGQREDGEIYLLIWKMIRLTRTIKSYFKLIPTNAIVQKITSEFKDEKDSILKQQKSFLEKMDEGVILLDMDNKIEYINVAAKRILLGDSNTKLVKADMNNRLYSDLFVSEDPEAVKERMHTLNIVTTSKKPMKFSKIEKDEAIEYKILPRLDINDYKKGLSIILRRENQGKKASFDPVKVMGTLKYLAKENKVLQEKTKEYDSQIHTLKQRNAISLRNLNKLSKWMDNIPLACAVLSMPGLEYEYVNDKMCRLLDRSKEQIISKKEESVFSTELMKKINIINRETIKTAENTTIEINGHSGIQRAMKDEKGQVTNIVRLLFK